MNKLVTGVLLALILTGCAKTPETPDSRPLAEAPLAAPPIPAKASALGGQRGDGAPYEVVGSEVWNVPDPVSGRTYQVFVALPASYADSSARRYPVLYVTDADYAFPLARQIGRRLNVEGPKLEEFILVGLSYSVGDEGMPSRRRDYTPTPNGPSSAPADAVHGGAAPYITYLREQALPFVAGRYRTDESRRLLLGHSYGALLGTQILFTDPGMFAGYIMGSPSFWYDRNVMSRFEKDYAGSHNDLKASVYMPSIGPRSAKKALWMAANTANVSYKREISPEQLAYILATGDLKREFIAHVATLLEEAPIPLLVMAVEEAAAKERVAPQTIWKNVASMADSLDLVRNGLFK